MRDGDAVTFLERGNDSVQRLDFLVRERAPLAWLAVAGRSVYELAKSYKRVVGREKFGALYGWLCVPIAVFLNALHNLFNEARAFYARRRSRHGVLPLADCAHALLRFFGRKCREEGHSCRTFCELHPPLS